MSSAVSGHPYINLATDFFARLICRLLVDNCLSIFISPLQFSLIPSAMPQFSESSQLAAHYRIVFAYSTHLSFHFKYIIPSLTLFDILPVFPYSLTQDLLLYQI